MRRSVEEIFLIKIPFERPHIGRGFQRSSNEKEGEKKRAQPIDLVIVPSKEFWKVKERGKRKRKRKRKRKGKKNWTQPRQKSRERPRRWRFSWNNKEK